MRLLYVVVLILLVPTRLAGQKPWVIESLPPDPFSDKRTRFATLVPDSGGATITITCQAGSILLLRLQLLDRNLAYQATSEFEGTLLTGVRVRFGKEPPISANAVLSLPDLTVAGFADGVGKSGVLGVTRFVRGLLRTSHVVVEYHTTKGPGLTWGSPDSTTRRNLRPIFRACGKTLPP